MHNKIRIGIIQPLNGLKITFTLESQITILLRKRSQELAQF